MFTLSSILAVCQRSSLRRIPLLMQIVHVSTLKRNLKMPRSSIKKSKCFFCNRTCSQRCLNCKLVHYCSREHYVFHHQRGYCFPFRIEWNQIGGGHALIAIRDIRPLELILFEWSIVNGPSCTAYLDKSRTCVGCHRETQGNSYHCIKCGLVLCKPECPAGNMHFLECGVLRNQVTDLLLSRDSRQYFLILSALRLIRTMRLNSRMEKQMKPFVENFHDIRDKEIFKDWFATRSELVEAVQKILGEPVHQNEYEWALELIRSHSVPGPVAENSVDVYPIFSVATNSCIRNAKHVIYPNRTLAIIAQRPIRFGDEITVIRVNSLEPTWKRRARLFRDHLFLCFCRRCRDPEEFSTRLSALRCEKCNECDSRSGQVLPQNPTDPKTCWSCTLHKSMRIPSENVERLVIDLQMEAYTKAREGHDPSDIIRDLKKFLHPDHALIVDMKRHILKRLAKSNKKDDLIRVNTICCEMFEVLNKIDPGFSDLRGDLLSVSSAVDLTLAKLDVQDGSIDRQTFLQRVKRATIIVQDAMRCRSCVRVDRSMQISVDSLVDEMSSNDSSYMSDINMNDEL